MRQLCGWTILCSPNTYWHPSLRALASPLRQRRLPHVFPICPTGGAPYPHRTKKHDSSLHTAEEAEISIFTQIHLENQWQAELEKEKEQWRKKEIMMLVFIFTTTKHCQVLFVMKTQSLIKSPQPCWVCYYHPIFSANTQHFREDMSPVRTPFSVMVQEAFTQCFFYGFKLLTLQFFRPTSGTRCFPLRRRSLGCVLFEKHLTEGKMVQLQLQGFLAHVSVCTGSKRYLEAATDHLSPTKGILA